VFSFTICFSLVEGEGPVGEARPERDHTPDAPEAAMALVDPLEHMLMSTVAERSIGGHLAVAQLVVAALSHVEADRSASGDNPLALSVAERVHLRVSATAPVVNLRSVQVDVSRENTGVCGHARRSISSLFIGSAVIKRDNVLEGEVGHVVHALFGSLGIGLQNLGLSHHNISLVGLQFRTSRTNQNKKKAQ